MNLKEGLINILIIFTILASIGYAVWYYIFYSTWKTGCCGKLKFKQFKQFYTIAPEKWELSDGYVRYYNDLIHSYIYFSQIDSIKYYFWKKSINKRTENNENNKVFMKTLEMIQKDIDDKRRIN